jgi:hypothetical protein
MVIIRSQRRQGKQPMCLAQKATVGVSLSDEAIVSDSGRNSVTLIDDGHVGLLRQRCCQAGRSERGMIPSECVKTTRFHRKHAIDVLGKRRDKSKGPMRRPRHDTCREAEVQPLLELSELLGGTYSKRLPPALD